MEERNHRKNLLILSTIFSFLLAFSAFAGNGFDAKFKQISSTTAQVNFDLNDFNITEEEIDGQEYSVINFEGSVVTEEKGFAQLPIISSTVQLQPYGDVDLKVVAEDYEDIKLSHPLLPSRGTIYRNQNPSEIPYVISSNSIRDRWYPAKLVRNSKPFIFRDVRGTSVYVHPFRYNSARNILRVYKSVSVQLETSRKSSTNTLVRMNPIVPTMDRIYRTMFINYGAFGNKRSVDIGELGDILVIYTSRDEDAIQPYIEWKKQKGFKVFEKVVSKGTNVKDIIQEEYDNNNNILYVQLVGDWEDIKSDKGPSSAPMDPMLGRVVGSDWFADIIVARFSAKSAADVAVQVEKTIDYEKNPDMNGTWYRRAIGIGSNEGNGKGDDGEADWKHMDVIRDNRLLPTTYDVVHQDYAKNGVTSTTVGNHVDDGVGFINYVGHGSTTSWVTSGFDNGDISKLKNKKMMPFIVSVACVNGEFHSSRESFAEAWLKKENGGAIGAWMSTINQPWAPPMRGQDYFSDLLIGGYNYSSQPGSGTNIYDQRTTYGSLTLNAAHLMYAENDGSSDLDTIQTWTVFGDGSLQVRTDTPKRIELSNDAVLMGIPFQTVVNGPNGPISGAMVSLYQDGKSFVGITNDLGEVEIEHELEVAKVRITVTAFNTSTISKRVNVIPPDGAYISVSEYAITGDGQADYGENVSLDIVLKNLGQDASRNIKAELETDSPYVAGISVGTVSTSYLAAGKTVSLKDAFSVTFVEDVADQTIVPFTVTISDSSKTIYESKISIVVNAPVLNYSFSVVGEGSIQPGESRELVYTVINNGHAKAYGVRAGLEVTNGADVAISQGEVSLGTIAAGASKDASFDVAFSDSIPTGQMALFGFEISANGGLEATYEQGVVVGMTESFENGSLGSFWNFSGNADWAANSDAYAGNFSGKSGTITHRESSTISFNASYGSAGTISFYKKVSSEARYDKLKFYIDGQLKDEWSGEVAWSAESYQVPAGNHEFTWTYMKDSIVDKGQDCAWIDNVIAEGGYPL